MAGFSQKHSELFAIFSKNIYPQHVLDMFLHCYVMKEVEGNDTRPSAGVEQQESPRHHFKIPYIRYFLGVANRGCANSSTSSVNHLTSSLFISLLKLRTYSKWKILSLTGFVHTSSRNFPVPAVMLVTLAKQGDTFPRACTSTCHQTDRLTFISTYRLQSLVVPPVTETALRSKTLPLQGIRLSLSGVYSVH